MVSLFIFAILTPTEKIKLTLGDELLELLLFLNYLILCY
jgi:hypothetical protein